MLLYLGLALILCQSNALFFGNNGDKWDALKVTWDINPLSSFAFASMPRTVGEARNEGFTQETSRCEASASKPFLGSRYLKDGDNAVMLLYDRHGYIAGIQVGIPKGLPRNYPSSMMTPPWIAEGNRYILTAYFVDPASICTSGRTSAMYESQGTGTGLYIQNGTDPVHNVLSIPHQEAAIANTKWTKGKCFKTMGMHYWYNLREDMSCDDFQPIFLLYNNGKLNAFGWAINADLQSHRFEHPPLASIGAFMEVPPKCLASQGRLSTMHIYMTDNPVLHDWC
ncbi:uncharacterized protein LOC135469143 [Liolophura sinensis]|uniref:uncharacterized protein LOC135469143 n=1 Tax=Liolophura sinensis TaxID=3198878 RepID=UPI003158B7B7